MVPFALAVLGEPLPVLLLPPTPVVAVLVVETPVLGPVLMLSAVSTLVRSSPLPFLPPETSPRESELFSPISFLVPVVAMRELLPLPLPLLLTSLPAPTLTSPLAAVSLLADTSLLIDTSLLADTSPLTDTSLLTGTFTWLSDLATTSALTLPFALTTATSGALTLPFALTTATSGALALSFALTATSALGAAVTITCVLA